MIRFAFLTLMFVFVLVPRVSAEGSSIGVVDVLHILTHSKAAKSIQMQREEMRSQFLQEVSETENALREQEKAILDKRGDLSPEAYAKERSEYESGLLEARKVAQGKKRKLEEASGAAMDVLREQLYLVVQSIANEQGYALVISNKNVIAGEKSLDITEETMKRLNEAVAEIPLNIEAE